MLKPRQTHPYAWGTSPSFSFSHRFFAAAQVGVTLRRTPLRTARKNATFRAWTVEDSENGPLQGVGNAQGITTNS
jgi:hypothetical protein